VQPTAKQLRCPLAAYPHVGYHPAGKTFCLPLVSGKEKSVLSENQRKIFADFHNSVDAEATLDEKTSHMIKVAAAMAFGCYP
jgi:hypothetical protein